MNPARYKHILLLLVFLGAVGEAEAQGFSTVSNRNHPELTWLEAASRHFRIMYPEHLSGIEVQAAAIAESTYTALSHNLGVEFEDPIRIYLSDEDEIDNGFAVRAGNGWTNIWVNANGTAENWTGAEKWLRKVISHELAHIFHYRATRSNIGLLDMLFANPLPRFWTEGLAQYQTENWDAFRGDIWLRTAVLEDRLSYRDGRSIWNGRLLYAVGNSQVRYLASQYGDSTITKILAHRRPALVGLVRVHDFNDAFRSVTGKTYEDFYDEWRRTVNIYYNTIAGQMSLLDSLGGRQVSTPGQYLYDAQAAGRAGEIAVLHLQSVERPVRRIEVTDTTSGKTRLVSEGAIRPPIAVSPDGNQIAFARLGRGENGSLVHNIFLVDTNTGDETRITTSRRAVSPTFSHDGRRVAFVAPHRGTPNIFVMDVEDKVEQRRTSFVGDVQISQLAWSPTDDRIAYYIFDADGKRRIEVLSLSNEAVELVTNGEHDDRRPVWSPDGSRLGFTSLRDGVPNVFIARDTTGNPQRVTAISTGATMTDWFRDDDGNETLFLVAADSKKNDRLFAVDLRTIPDDVSPTTPPGFAAWTRHRPPRQIPARIESTPGVIVDRSGYNAWSNLTHVVSAGLPYFNNRDDWGLAAGTIWVEPLGKHVLGALAGVSVPSTVSRSFFAATYINRQRTPSLIFGISRLPDVARPYGKDFLHEDRNEASIDAVWPLDIRPRPFVSTSLLARIRFINLKPLDEEKFADEIDNLPVPEAGSQLALRLAIQRKKLRPFRSNALHPLDGWGARARITVATRDADFARSYVRIEASSYRVIPIVERHRLFIHGRIRMQYGTALPQDFIGLARYDRLRVRPLPFLDLTLTGADRVRGYRRTVVGDRVAFGTLEYRIPLVPTLRTQLLGIVSLGGTALSPFLDAGVVWSRPNDFAAVYQYGAGVELKNTLEIADLFKLTHAIGFAQPVETLGSRNDYDIYYKIQTALPF
ncbi:MAG: PD40 domain-containing protein [Rhodothermia bacterium]|nr:PD40 domain-containing protein [Rhodothermia bacterium]